jgi:hypothetical protein
MFIILSISGLLGGWSKGSTWSLRNWWYTHTLLH